MADARVIISADASKHVSEMGRAGKSVKDYGDKWKGVKDMAIGQTLANIAQKAASLAVDAGKAAFQFATSLKDLSQQTGLSVTELQALIYTGEDMGIEMGNTTNAVLKLLAEFDNMKKTGEISADFKAMGFTVEEMGKISDNAGSQIEAFSKKLKDVEGDSQKTAAGMSILGTKTRKTADIFKEVGGKGFEGKIGDFGSKMLTSGQVDRLDRLEQYGRDKARSVGATIVGASGIGTADATRAIDSKMAEDRAARANLALKDPEEVKRRAEEAKRNEKIEKIQAESAKDVAALNDKSIGGGATAADQMASIGGALGGQSTFATRVADKQLQVAEETKKIMAKVADDIAAIKKEGGGLE
jgi:hypothetical protein